MSDVQAPTITGSECVQAALVFATFAAFAISGPFGILLAGTLAATNVLYGASQQGSGSAPLTGAQVGAIIQNSLDSQNLQSNAAKLERYATEFRAYIGEKVDIAIATPPHIEEELRANPHGPFAGFYNLVYNAVYSPEIIDEVNALTQDDGISSGVNLRVTSLPTVLDGASLLAALYKVLLLTNEKGGVALDTGRCRFVVQTLDAWIAYIHDSCDYIDQQISGRLGLIGQVTPYDYWGTNTSLPIPDIVDDVVTIVSSIGAGAGGGHEFGHYNLTYFSDTGQPVPGVSLSATPDSAALSKAPAGAIYAVWGTSPDITAPAQAVHDKYYADVQAALPSVYSDYDRGSVQAILMNLSSARDFFQSKIVPNQPRSATKIVAAVS